MTQQTLFTSNKHSYENILFHSMVHLVESICLQCINMDNRLMLPKVYNAVIEQSGIYNLLNENNGNGEIRRLAVQKVDISVPVNDM